MDDNGETHDMKTDKVKTLMDKNVTMAKVGELK